MSDSCPYLKDVEADLQARNDWAEKDKAIQKRRLGERPKKRNKPYPNAPNPVERLVDDNTNDKTDQEISMIMNAPVIAIMVPLGTVEDATLVSQAQKGFNTYLRHLCGYRQKKEEAVDTKNARGFAVTKPIREEHPDWGLIPSFETVDPRDCIVPVTFKVGPGKEPERFAYINRFSYRDFKKKVKAGWNRKAIAEVISKVTVKDADGEVSVSESDHDDDSTFKVTKELIGLNTSDRKSGEIVVWEIFHYATAWDAEKSGGIVKKGEKCVSYVCPDVPGELLKVMPWCEQDYAETNTIEDPLRGAYIDTRMVKGKDKAMPLIQHRYSYRSRLWYDTEGIGQKNMDLQIKATAIERAILILIDHISDPTYTSEGEFNQQNIVKRPGAVLPNGIKPVDERSRIAILEQLNFQLDAVKRVASKRAGIAGGIYSSQMSESRKLQKTATEVDSENATQDVVSSASVDRFNDPDTELFRQIWADMRRMRTRLPVIDNGRFEGIINDAVYDIDFLIIPAASQKTLNPDLQFRKSSGMMSIVAERAEITGADVAAGDKHMLQMADPVLANLVFPDPDSGEVPITTTLNALSQAVEQLTAGVEEATAKADQALDLGSEVAGAL